MDPRIRNIKLKSALSAMADLAMPRVCIVCGTPLIPQEQDICTQCLVDMPKTRFWETFHNPMADKFNALVEDDRYCFASALYYYDEDAGYKKISQELKYRRNFTAGRHFARMLGTYLASSDQFKDVDTVMPVPLHWTRKWKRGYNQSAIIGKEIAECLCCKMTDSVLKRIKKTRTQTLVKTGNKMQNVADAFLAEKDGNEYHHILIVDDVFTTGSTVSSCHKALRKVFGPQTRISVAVLGYVK